MSETTTTTPILDEIRREARNDDRIGRSYDLLREAIRSYRNLTMSTIDTVAGMQLALSRTIDDLSNGRHCDSDGIGNGREIVQRQLAKRAAVADQIRQLCWVNGIDTVALFEEIGSL